MTMIWLSSPPPGVASGGIGTFVSALLLTLDALPSAAFTQTRPVHTSVTRGVVASAKCTGYAYWFGLLRSWPSSLATIVAIIAAELGSTSASGGIGVFHGE